jgi:hypothetical protein
VGHKLKTKFNSELELPLNLENISGHKLNFASTPNSLLPNGGLCSNKPRLSSRLSNAPHRAICARSTCSAQTIALRALRGVQHAVLCAPAILKSYLIFLSNVTCASPRYICARSTCSAQTIAPRALHGVQHARSVRLPSRQSLSPAFHLPIFLPNAPHCAICARSTCPAQTRAIRGVQHARSVRLPSRARSTCSAQTIAPRACSPGGTARALCHVRLPSNPPIQQALHRAQSCALRTPSTCSTLAAALRALRLPIFQSNAPHRARSLGTSTCRASSRATRAHCSPIFRSSDQMRLTALSVHAQRAWRKQSRRVLSMGARSTCSAQTIAPRAHRGARSTCRASSRATRAHCSPIFRSSDQMRLTALSVCTLNVLGANNRAACPPGGHDQRAERSSRATRAHCSPIFQSSDLPIFPDQMRLTALFALSRRGAPPSGSRAQHPSLAAISNNPSPLSTSVGSLLSVWGPPARGWVSGSPRIARPRACASRSGVIHALLRVIHAVFRVNHA